MDSKIIHRLIQKGSVSKWPKRLREGTTFFFCMRSIVMAPILVARGVLKAISKHFFNYSLRYYYFFVIITKVIHLGKVAVTMSIGLLPFLCDNEKYLMNQIVIIVARSKWFGLVRVRYKDEKEEFWIDEKSLTTSPDYSHTISLHLMGGRI